MNIQTLKGFRDFLPEEYRKRLYVLNILRSVFESFGFEPLETPTIEYEEILMGKYGEEGDKLMYKFEDNGGRRVALRYDQTVPLSRVVAQYQSQLPIPFKRYQIQPVFRAENTQKGRYREFIQCDIDTVGTNSLYSDAEILAVVFESFKKLGLEVLFKINDRALLKDIPNKYLTSLDKLEKIGRDGVLNELGNKGLETQQANELLNNISKSKETENLNKIIEAYKKLGYPKESLEFDPYLIRGLDYYTGIIFEVVLRSENKSLSLGGGGRYDNLIGIFSKQDIPAVGFAFGFDRVVETMEELNIFPEDLYTTEVLVTIFSTDLEEESVKASSKLREGGINTELWLDANIKLEKQLKYADSKGIPYVVIIGPDETKNGMVMLKDLKNNKQTALSLDGVIQKLSS